VGSSAHEDKPRSDKHAGYVSEELSLPEGSMDYFFEESARRVPVVDAPCRFDEPGYFADGPTRFTATVAKGK
jgi:hypothetical protein